MEVGHPRLDTGAMNAHLSVPHRAAVADRVGGALLGLAVGDAGAADATALVWAVTRSYLDGYSDERVMRHVVDWYDDVPREIAPMANAVIALGLTEGTADACLVRAVPAALVRPATARRHEEVTDLCRITHADERSVEACVAYADLLDQLVEGVSVTRAVEHVLAGRPLDDQLTVTLARAAITGDVRPPAPAPGDAGATLGLAVWAACQPRPFAEVLLDVAELTRCRFVPGAVAGGLLGARDGLAGIPAAWLARVAYRDQLLDAVPILVELRRP